MAARTNTRTINRGYIVYTGADGRPATGYLGEEVEVHKDDLERFDSLNQELVVAEPAKDERGNAPFSQADVDAAVKAATEAQAAELAEAKKLAEAAKAEAEAAKAELAKSKS